MDKYFELDFIYLFCDGIIFCEILGLEILRLDYDFLSVLIYIIIDRDKLRKLDVLDFYMSGCMLFNIESLLVILKSIKKLLYELI